MSDSACMKTPSKHDNSGRAESADDRVLLRPRSFAAKADISPSFVYKLVANGNLRSVSVGRSIRIPATEIDRLLAGEIRG